MLVLDEPTAALPEADVEPSARCAEAAARRAASAIIYVTHRLDEVFRIADRVTVLRDGRRVATLPVAETSPDDLVEKIVGRSMGDAFVKPAPPSERVVLAVDGRRRWRRRAGVVRGRGRRDAGPRRLARRRPPRDRPGGLRPDAAVGRPCCAGRPNGSIAADPADAMRQQIGFVSSRRAEESIAANMSVRENVYINPVATGKASLQPGLARRGARRCPRRSRALFGEAARPGARGRHAQRRQPAESGRGALDGGEGASSDPGGADDRRRRRLESGNLSPAPAILTEGLGGAAALVGFRGSGAHLSSRAGVQPRARRRRNSREANSRSRG